MFLKRKSETITEKEWKKVEDLSMDWVTCACGNQCYILSRDSTGQPDDDELFDLGCQFNISIQQRDLKEAKQILYKIEKRSVKLIKEEINKAKRILQQVEGWEFPE